MAITHKTAHQHSLIQKTLMEQLNPKDALIMLSRSIPWDSLCAQFVTKYSELGRPAKDIRLMIGLLLLKQMENLSDERLVVEWTRNPYFQAFCGESHFQWKLPCDPSDISRFRKRIGTEGCEAIFKASVQMVKDGKDETADGKRAELKEAFAEEVVIDSTVQEKNVAYPTDSRLYRKIIEWALRIGRDEKITFRQTYAHELKRLQRIIRFSRGNKSKDARKAERRLHTIAGRVFRELERKLSAESKETHKEFLTNGQKILQQSKGDVDRIYSLSEPQVACITKGKAGKRHEYGSKASICMDKDSCAIVGVASFSGAPHDSTTLDETLACVSRVLGMAPRTAYCDRGYRGRTTVGTTEIVIPGSPVPSASEEDRAKARRNFRRRSAIEPVIGHLKNDFRMARCYLKGALGDAMNLLMAAAAFNLRKWVRAVMPVVVFLSLDTLKGLLMRLGRPFPCLHGKTWA